MHQALMQGTEAWPLIDGEKDHYPPSAGTVQDGQRRRARRRSSGGPRIAAPVCVRTTFFLVGGPQNTQDFAHQFEAGEPEANK
jgi:hypothetical protein